MARVNRVQKCQKSPGKCSRCGDTIKKGDPYSWAQLYRSPKRLRCSKSECRFRASDLTGSDKLSRVYGAQENAEDAISGWSGEDAEDIAQALRDAAEEIRTVAEEYRESAENIRSSIAESPTADECEEKADNLESWADDIENAADSLPDKEDEDTRCREMDDDEELRCTEDHEHDGDHKFDKKNPGEAYDEDANNEWQDSVREHATNALAECPV